MSSSYVARLAPAAATYATLYTVPSDMVLNIRAVNRDLVNAVAISVAISPAETAPSAPATADYIEAPLMILPAGSILEEIGIPVIAGEVVTIYNSAASVTWRLYGR